MTGYSDYYKAREEIVDIVSEDLLGPVYADEVLNEAPTSYYIMGKLYPKTDRDLELDDATTSTDLEEMDADNSLAGANMRNPRAMGITYTVKKTVKTVHVTVKHAFYKPYSLSEAEENNINITRYREIIEQTEEKNKQRLKFWERSAFSDGYDIPVDKNSIHEIAPSIYLKTYLHMVSSTGERILTSVITNERYIADGDRDQVAANTVFQPEIHICGCDKNKFVFSEIKRRVSLTNNMEILQMDMLYSQSGYYAQGHGCSVVWDDEQSEPLFIKSSFMPTFNLAQMKAAEIKDNPVFNIHYLFTAKHDEIMKNLHDFTEKYDSWISDKLEESKSAKYTEYTDTARTNLNTCSEINNRIKRSVDFLEDESGNAWKAFRLANEAMYLQRLKTIEKAAGSKKNHSVTDPSRINWYPFQLAFILLEISSFVEPFGNERKLVDLLWFPTGGGKTEAYLGIAAFEIFYRRLSNPDNCNGLTVIMRYTLRLLTIQQFERASMLICACELLRKKYNIPGDEISIGLWVGNSFTPGTIDDADTALIKIMSTGQLGSDDVDPCQVKICPWCGRKLYPVNYKIKPFIKRMEICCPNEECDYYGIPLPVRLIDEEIYEYRPTFLVATVDKFAQIAIQEKTSALFSIDNDSLPPELIIQDELHLISGPLGTMTGIYEAAITQICESKGRVAKIIASTATIRNASKQILALYGRDYNQFPPLGISSEDSFFAIKANTNERPARLYVGIMGVGTTFTTTLIRLYASWLFASRYLLHFHQSLLQQDIGRQTTMKHTAVSALW